MDSTPFDAGPTLQVPPHVLQPWLRYFLAAGSTSDAGAPMAPWTHSTAQEEGPICTVLCSSPSTSCPPCVATVPPGTER
jgi:hypothetical protein